MRAEYDSRAHALFISVVEGEWDPAPVDDISDSVFVHRDADGRAVGIEVLAADRTSDDEVSAAAEACSIPRERVLAARAAALRAPDQAVELTFPGSLAA